MSSTEGPGWCAVAAVSLQVTASNQQPLAAVATVANKVKQKSHWILVSGMHASPFFLG
jgi:hypothetical protein